MDENLAAKKAKSGIATPKRELDVIRRRLKEAKEEYREYQRNQKAKNS
jgi:phage-related protein